MTSSFDTTNFDVKIHSNTIEENLMKRTILVTVHELENKIYLVRSQKVMLDSDLASLYEVETKALIQAVKRNSDRFPEDFMFQTSEKEASFLRSQFVTSKLLTGSGGRRHLPYVFTEQGVAMLSSVLRSPRAIKVNIEIMRAFVRIRQILVSNVQLAKKLNALEKRYDSQFKIVFDAIRQLMLPPSKPLRKIGFK